MDLDLNLNGISGINGIYLLLGIFIIVTIIYFVDIKKIIDRIIDRLKITNNLTKNKMNNVNELEEKIEQQFDNSKKTNKDSLNLQTNCVSDFVVNNKTGMDIVNKILTNHQQKITDVSNDILKSQDGMVTKNDKTKNNFLEQQNIHYFDNENDSLNIDLLPDTNELLIIP
jgi:hypothetical protein